MTIPYMREFVAGAPADKIAVQEIGELFGHLGWYFRAIDEISVDAQLDKKKVLWLMKHGTGYRAAYAKLAARIANEGTVQDSDWPFTRPAGEIAGMIEGKFALNKMRWVSRAAMFGDFAQVNTDALNVINWINANIPDWGTSFATRTVTQVNGVLMETEETAKITLPPDLLASVLVLRSRFAVAA